jgi:hypothetical protein
MYELKYTLISQHEYNLLTNIILFLSFIEWT